MLLVNHIQIEFAYVKFVTNYKVFDGERFELIKELLKGTDVKFVESEVEYVTYLPSRNDISPEQKLVEKCMRYLLGRDIDFELLKKLKSQI